jgi:hypothetical protein
MLVFLYSKTFVLLNIILKFLELTKKIFTSKDDEKLNYENHM